MFEFIEVCLTYQLAHEGPCIVIRMTMGLQLAEDVLVHRLYVTFKRKSCLHCVKLHCVGVF